MTFYRMPESKAFETWYALSPPDFRFAVKAPQLITHYKQFHNVQLLLGSFYDTTGRGLLEKLGPVLFQLPPRTAYEPDRLARILDCLDPSFVNVPEFRHPSWWRLEVCEELASRQVIFCGQSHPQLPDAVVATAPVLYYRFHGVPELYRSPYDEDFLRRITDEIKGQSGVQEAYLYFNNDIDASAIGNARQMLAMV